MTHVETSIDGTAKITIEEHTNRDDDMVDQDGRGLICSRTLCITVHNEDKEYVLTVHITANDLDIYNLHL